MEDAAEDEEDVLVVLLLWLLHLLLSLPFSELVVVIVVAVEEDEALSLRVDVLDVVEDAPSNSMSKNARGRTTPSSAVGNDGGAAGSSSAFQREK